MRILFCLFAFISIFTRSSITFTGELFPYQRADDCKVQEFYSINALTCKYCMKEKFLTPSDNKLSCTCNNKSMITRWEGEFPICAPCKDKEEPTKDQLSCVSCPLDKTNNQKCSSTNSTVCAANEILVERDVQGKLLPAKLCSPCAGGMTPNEEKTQCIPCRIPNCVCPIGTHELLDANLCAPKSELSTLPDEQSIYMVDFDNVRQVIKSHYLKTYLRSSLYRCTKLKKSKYCQAVANMCVMLLYKDEQNGGPCRIFREYRYIPTSTANDNNLPWLYYGEGDASILLNRKKIESHYDLNLAQQNSVLRFVAARYALDGNFLGLSSISGSDLQLCPGVSKHMDLAFRFGSRYRHACKLTAKELLTRAVRNEFFDLFLHHYDKSNPLLYAVPLVIKNISVNAEFSNKDVDVSQWLLTRRFFFLDNVSGVAYSSEKSKIVSDVSPSVVRYLKSAKLWIKTRREKEDEGKIYPPFLILEYGELTNQDISSNSLIDFSFSVDYYMDNDIPHIIDVTIGILSAAVVVWSGIQTWSYCRRSGQMTIDMSTLVELGLTCCGYFSTMLFIVAAAVALHTLLFYKAQSVAYIMLPSENLENTVNKYIVVAFLLKIVEVVRLMYMQMKIDIFLIDWERPRATGGFNATETQQQQHQQQQPVSIWRTYFVANEWNEIQTKRKTSLIFQMLLTLLIIKVCGVENWMQADPDIHINHVPYRPESLILRFGVTLVVYVFIYVSQWLLLVGVYERYIKNGIQEFVDVCSMANVSVFILLQENYGYYIHGRSAHGFADTDMQTILTQLRREEDDLVGHRGLLPGTEQQTFQIIIPTALRSYYNKVMSSMNTINNKQSGTTFRRKAVDNDDAGRIVEAYNNMNKFLAAFLDHALKDLDYEVREKLFVEQLLDIEFADSLDRGVFYIGKFWMGKSHLATFLDYKWYFDKYRRTVLFGYQLEMKDNKEKSDKMDNGHSFDGVLFYGNEGTLFSFDLMMLLCIDVFCHDILYAAILTVLISQIIVWIRNQGGRRNLAKKTLVDDRFLI